MFKSASGTRQSTKKQRMVALLPTDTVWSVEQLLDSGKVVEFVAGEPILQANIDCMHKGC